ncbi:uncharacterized protein LOC120086822 [Benincasa hispida]|uniref:uncharacterized protein LOC120086822 n=1 Tax=Benincasa hispida TaxID=102211 RepID=UPI00190158F4|nr:uncharacterized protein LOC120086822 [Benincasa hispida]
MPLLAGISTAQPAFHNFHRTVTARSCFHVNKSLGSLTFGNDKELSSSWKSLIIPKRVNFSAHPEISRRVFLIRAVATLESKRVVLDGNRDVSMGERTEFKNSQVGVAPSTSEFQLTSSSGDSEELDERERLRRERISKANKGNTPWNKGRKHSAETLRRIKERTRLAMQDPKVKMKLVKLGHAQSEETRLKIGVGVRMGWQRRREKLVLQETCHFEWQNLIAEASRQGYKGEEELQWDSYQILNEELKKEWVESVEQRKKMPRPVGSRRAPKSAEQRKKISESISAKWADPEYRDRVCSALAKYHGTPIGVNRRPRRKRSESTDTMRTSQKKEKSDVNSSFAGGSRIENQRLKLRKIKAPRFKDPLASSKLEMIKSIRAQRAIAETQKTEAVEQARLLIAEAEKAAEALEVAATRSPIARASLLETRKLIAEAIQSIESIDIKQMASPKTEEPNAEASHSYEVGTPNNEGESLGGKEDQIRAVQTIANGTQLFSSSIDEDFDFSKFSLQDLIGGEKEVPASSNGYGVSHSSFSSLANQPNGNKPSSSLNGTKLHHLEERADSQVITVTKKWVRGRLVEVAKGC